MAFLYTGGGFLNSCNYQSLEDSVLSALSKKGDGKAFEEITIRYIKLICSVAKKYSAYGYELQDFIQEGLLSFLLACKTYSADCGSSYKNYAVKCTKNRFADIVKKANAKGSVPANKIVSIQTVEDEQDLSNNVEDYVLEREYLKTFLQHISSTLNEEERNIFQMYINGYSYKDIADKLGISTKNVDNILQKIKRKLRQ